MAKKSKDPKNKNPNPKSDQNSTPPDSSNIFNKLFGEIPESAEPSTSLFSSDNPFRRKPPILENPKNGEVENPKNGEVGNASEVTQMEKKKNKHKRDSLDENASKPTKELKMDDGQKGNLEMGNGLGLGVNLEEKEGKKKNKRKRDELERDYEVKKYGEAPEEAVAAAEEKLVAGKKRKAVDNPAEMMVSNEGYDDESKLLRTVFVGNLPLKMKKKGLLKEFTKFGEVESIRIRSVPTLDSKKPKKVQIINKNINEAADSIHAYIVFKTEQSAEASLAHNMSVVGGNHIRVDRACPPRKKLKGDEAPLYNNKRTVFVGNLPFDVKDEELYQLFCGIKQLESTVEAVRVIRDPQTSLGKGIAYVLFKTREAANFVCKKRTLKIRDRELRISHTKSDTQSTTTPSKRKNPFPVDQEKTPVKKLTPGSTRTPESRYKVTTPGDTSYQGVHATKSGVEKKRTPVRSARPVASSRSTSGTKTKDKVKQRSDKRPSVAARKAKANALLSRGTSGGGVGSNQAGTKKRKMDARTPQSSNQKKKQAKKFQGRAK